MLFQDEGMHYLWECPMKCHTSVEFVQAFDSYQRFVSTFFRSELLVAHAICNFEPMAGQLCTYCDSSEMRQYLDQNSSSLVIEWALQNTPL